MLTNMTDDKCESTTTILFMSPQSLSYHLSSMEQPPTFNTVLKFLKEKRKQIYVKGKVPKRLTGPYHGLFLQLLANGILDLTVDEKEKKNIGTAKLLGKHIVVKLGMKRNDGRDDVLSILEDSSWEGIIFN